MTTIVRQRCWRYKRAHVDPDEALTVDSSVLPAIGNIVVPGAAASAIQELAIVLAHTAL